MERGGVGDQGVRKGWHGKDDDGVDQIWKGVVQEA